MNAPLLLDGPAIKARHQAAKVAGLPVNPNPNYGAILPVLRSERPGVRFEPAVAFAAVDPKNENQMRFVHFLESQGFAVEACDYRHAYVLPNRAADYQRLTHLVAYTLGQMVAASPARSPHVYVVADAFPLYHILADYVTVRRGKATLVFWKSGLEPRWADVGLFEPGCPIEFLDLDPHSRAILGADITPAAARPVTRGGLASLDLRKP